MEKKQNQISMLQYQIQRHQAMGNGCKCQQLISQMNKLMNGGQSAF